LEHRELKDASFVPRKRFKLDENENVIFGNESIQEKLITLDSIKALVGKDLKVYVGRSSFYNEMVSMVPIIRPTAGTDMSCLSEKEG